ncbi:MAG: cell shape determination protein CcmA, partial [Gammaproteobacteria bacterium]
VNGQLIHQTEKNENILNVEHEIIDDEEAFQLEQKD